MDKLRKSSVIFTLSLLLSSSIQADDQNSAVADEELSHELQIFSQNLGFYLPKGWQLGSLRLENSVYSAEYVPDAYGLRGWQSLFCVQGFKGMAESVNARSFLNSFAVTYEENCQGEVYFKMLEAVNVSGHSGVTALLGCTLMPNTHKSAILKEHDYRSEPRGEVGYYTVLNGKDDLYMLHKSVRGKTFTIDSLPVNRYTWPDFIKQMQPYSLQ